MDEIIVSNKKYISSKRAADISGYTPDYVGQLCRGGKIEGMLVGRSWYVDPQSVLSHKQAYHSDAPGKSAELSSYASEPVLYSRDTGQQVITTNFVNRSASVRYADDESTLNPTPAKENTTQQKVAPSKPAAPVTPSLSRGRVSGDAPRGSRSFFTVAMIFIVVIFGLFFFEQRISYSSVGEMTGIGSSLGLSISGLAEMF